MKYNNFQINIILIIRLLKLINSQNKDFQIICGLEKCDLKGGKCSINLNCTCNKGYDTFYKYNDLKCNYKKISKFKAGILEFFFGFGIGHFYSLRYHFAEFKLSLYLFLILCCFFSIYQIKEIFNENEVNDYPKTSICVLFSIGLFIFLLIWQFIDYLLFFFGFYLDGNNIKMN
jgi:hypothetical protein